MEAAKQSYAVDIAAGFDLIHLDPSIDIHDEQVEPAELLQRLFELYEFCEVQARRHGRRLVYEIGTEEQTGEQQDRDELADFLDQVKQYCQTSGAPEPFFVVVQTGTKVKETENVGNLSSPHRLKGIIPPEVQITRLVKLCEEYGVHVKEHNTDYLSDEVLRWHPRVGVHAANVAPEFGVVETRHILHLCQEFKLEAEQNEFLQLALDSGKWRKWLRDDTKAGDYEKAVMAGHYVFSQPQFVELKARIALQCKQSGFDLEESIRASLKHAMRRYLEAFNLLDG